MAIVTKKHGVALAHIAAGTRSFDLAMPKEINRLVIDGLSDMLFTAGISNNSIANKEERNYPKSTWWVTCLSTISVMTAGAGDAQECCRKKPLAMDVICSSRSIARSSWQIETNCGRPCG